MDNRELYEKAIEKWGTDAQVIMALEECGELIVAITQGARGRDVSIIEEIADVQIMMEQLAILYGEEQVEYVKNQKLKRLKQRLGIDDDSI